MNRPNLQRRKPLKRVLLPRWMALILTPVVFLLGHVAVPQELSGLAAHHGWTHTKQKKFTMYQDAVRKPVGQWVNTRLKKLSGKSTERHNSENNSGFGRDLRNWIDKSHVLPGNTISIPLVGKDMGHPAAFPVGLPEFFIKLFTKPDDVVLDPFAGSGTTGVAALNLNRNVVLIDIKKEYCEVTKERLAKIKQKNNDRNNSLNNLSGKNLELAS